jgi:3-oxocholest-4-en-26-oyl-CoA dehydrogenase beta subunit
MRLALDPEQERVAGRARELLAEHLPADRLNEVEALAEGYDPELLRLMLEARLHAVPLLLDLGLVLEECGRAVLRSPFFPTAVTLVALRRFGSGAGAESAAARIERGATAALALPGQDLVEWATEADLVVRAGEKGLELTESPRTSAVETFDGARVAQLAAGGAWSAVSGRLGAYELERLRALVAALRAAEMAGGARKVLELTVDHVTARRQFGAPLGTLQAVQHLCAELAMAVEGARLAALESLWKADHGLPFLRDAAVATWFGGQTYEQAALTASELHGGQGYLKEYHLHHHFRRAKAQRLRLGSEREQLERVAIEMFDERPEVIEVGR